jgi:hypothetical protein
MAVGAIKNPQAVKKPSPTVLSLQFRKRTGSVIASSSTLIFLLDRMTD